MTARDATFFNAILVNANLEDAKLDNARFLPGDSVHLTDFPLFSLAIHPTDNNIIVYPQGSKIMLFNIMTKEIVAAFECNDVLVDRNTLQQHQIYDVDDGFIKISFLNWGGEYHLAAVTVSGTVLMWNITCPTTIVKRLTLESIMLARCIATYENFIAIGINNGKKSICLWNIDLLENNQPCYLQNDDMDDSLHVHDLQFSHDGDFLASSYDFLTFIHVWRKNSEQNSYTSYQKIECNGLIACGLAFNINNDLAVGVVLNQILLYRLNSGEYINNIRLTPHHSEPNDLKQRCYALVFSSEKILVVGSIDHTIFVWDIENQRLLKKLYGHSDSVIKLVANSSTVFSASSDKTIRQWYIDRQEHSIMPDIQPQKGHSSFVHCLSVSDKGTVFSGGEDTKVCVWSTTDPKRMPIQIVMIGLPIVSMAYGNSFLFLGAWEHIYKCEITEKGMLSFDDGLKKYKIIAYYMHNQYFWDITFINDHQVAACTNNWKIYIWKIDASLTRDLTPLDIHTHLVRSLAYCPENQYLVSGSWDKTVRVSKITDNFTPSVENKGYECPQKLPTIHDDQVDIVAIHPQNGHLASAGKDQMVYLWKFENQQYNDHIALSGHTFPVSGLVFHQTHYLFSSSEQEIILWDIHSHEKVTILSFGARHLALKGDILIFSYKNSVAMLKLSTDTDNISAIKWMMASPTLWLQGCKMTDITVSSNMSTFFKKEGCIIQENHVANQTNSLDS